MRIDFLCNDGSPLGPTSKTVWGDSKRVGTGGAELAMLTMCEEWTKAGYEVRLYNDPWEENASPFQQLPVAAFRANEPRDVLIVFRSPNPHSVSVNNCLKVWWSCDQQTVGDFKQFSTTVDKIVCISPFHQNYFVERYGITNTISIDLPVRAEDYFQNFEIEKVKNRVIFTSVPARGLMNLNRLWPTIKQEVPDASLVITSDYRLWGVAPSNEHFKIKFMLMDGVEYVGAIPRKQLLEEELKAELLLYPSNYEELFCYAVAEAEFAGAYPITSGTGALKTTNMGIVLDVNADNPASDRLFINETINFLTMSDAEKAKLVYDTQKLAITRFSPERILKIWDKEVFGI
jgi:glycosyltransferase involved in cell wall biosynthesis